MAKTTFTITDYNISRLGYIKPYAPKNQILFGGYDSTLKALLDWSTGKSLLETQTYGASVERLPTYLMDIVTHKNQYLICLWNESAVTAGELLSVPLTDPVGTTNISGASIKQGNIAGFPTYFWLKPDENTYSTIQSPTTLNGRENLHKYIENFLGKFHPTHVVSEKDESGPPSFRSSV